MKPLPSIAATACLVVCTLAHPAIATAQTSRESAKPETLFNGKNLDGWTLRESGAKTAWNVTTDVALDKNDKGELVGSGKGGGADAVLLCSLPGRGADLITTREFGDCTVKLECMLPSGGNSGVYLMGRYEVQLYDSHGRPDDKLKHSDLGGIYSVSAPAKNAAKPAGEWQTLEIQFRAPRFDEHGKKVENARIIRVVLNGVRVQSDVELKGPTGGELPGGEKARGPLMLQGDHSPVAFRNLTIQPQ